MSVKAPQIMLDTNVWLDVFVPGRAGSATATRLVRSAIEANATLLYSARIITELFYEIRRDAAEWVRASAGSVPKEAARLCHDYAWSCIEDLYQLAVAVGTDNADVQLALRYRTLSEDLDDNLMLTAAQRADVDYLVTSDRILLSKATVAALAPQDMLTVLETGL
ncbi:MAG: PIN domain-containing protein [Atopobiaceae bacterium]|nr:PIN domain-containing protein [Atopobiaceae bacterium]